MNSRREQVWVGLFVLIAVALLIGTVLAVSGTFRQGGIAHHSYFKFAGGLVPGATVRYGGLKAGKVGTVRVDPADSTRIEIQFKVNPDIPLKTDSVAKITSLGALDENYVELSTGTLGASLAPPGSVVKSVETVGLGDIGNMIGGLEPVAQEVLQNLNQRLVELKVTVASVNDVLDEQNRAKINVTLGNLKSGSGNLNSLLAENRPKISATLTNVQAASAKLVPLLDNLQTTMGKADDTLSHVNSMVVENSPDIRASVVELKQTLLTASQTLANASRMVNDLRSMLGYQTYNIDQTLDNVRIATQNMKELTDELKRNPSILIRGQKMKERKPGGKN